MTLAQIRRLDRAYRRARARLERRMRVHGLDHAARQARILELRISGAFRDAATSWCAERIVR